MVVAADLAFSANQVLTDTYENADGSASVWSKGYFDEASQSFRSRDIASLGQGAYLVVGTDGFMRYRDSSGNWSNQLSEIKSGMGSRQFEGVWAGEELIAVSAWWQSGGHREFELWTCPVGADPTQGSNWTIHSVGSGEGNSDGLFDVWGVDDGQMVLVGAKTEPSFLFSETEATIYAR